MATTAAEPRGSAWTGDVVGRTSPSWVRCVTTPASWLYRVGVAARNFKLDLSAGDALRLPGVKTISVGNLAVGGTGKSPVAIALARALVARGHRPAILARGYRSGMASWELVVLRNGIDLGGRDLRRLSLDEARMQSAALPTTPIVASRSRYVAALEAVELLEDQDPGAVPTHWILDDGFQHRGIRRDVDLVLLDWERPFGNGRLLPRGPLREPASSLARATHVMLTRAEPGDPPGDALARLRAEFKGPILRAAFVPGKLVPATGGEAFDPRRHGPALVATGIARPSAFLDQVRAAGVKAEAVYVVGDHRRFDVGEMTKRAAPARAVVTTAKDYWRDPSVFAALPIPTFVQELDVHADFGPLLDAW